MKAIELIRALINLDMDADVRLCVSTDVQALKCVTDGEDDDEPVTIWADINHVCDWFGDGIVRIVGDDEGKNGKYD